jgi:riboflavin synthase
MNQTNREVPGIKERPASGEPVLAEVGRPVILSLGVAGYFSVLRTSRSAFVAGPDGAPPAVDFRV